MSMAAEQAQCARGKPELRRVPGAAGSVALGAAIAAARRCVLLRVAVIGVIVVVVLATQRVRGSPTRRLARALALHSRAASKQA